MQNKILDLWQAISFQTGKLRFTENVPTTYVTNDGYVWGGFVPNI